MREDDLRDACVPGRLRALAGEPSFQRGEEYARDGRVEGLTVRDDSVTATVRGSEPYRVALQLVPADGLGGSCTCPVGETGAFCKHCVAVGLVAARPTHAGDAALRAHLTSLPRAELVELVLAAVGRDPLLRDSLQLDMAAAAGDPAEALASAIDEAASVSDFIRWDEAWAHAERLDAVLDALQRRLASGHGSEVIELAEYFVTAVEAQLGEVDDSSGAVGSTIARAEALHLTACRQVSPEPVALADRLFELETSTESFGDALAGYAHVLGEAGRARYAELAEVEWASGTPSWTLSRLMERLAGDDVDRLVAIKARTVEHAWDYQEIATLLRDAGRLEDAIRWARRGVAAHSDAQLREFVAECHLEAGRPEEALPQRAAQFREQPTLAAYTALHAQAEALGRWPEERAAAMAVLEAPTRGIWPRDRSMLVAVLLWEGDVALAWEQAHVGGCSRDLWRALARERAAERPRDAVDVYRRLLSATIDLRNDSGYDGAVELLDELHALLAPHGREATHVALVAEIREVHRRKRNLIKRLDAHRWATPSDQALPATSPDPLAPVREHAP
jgi:uncharacterized Zn finger protein